jgi:hypothetical protein
MIFFDAAARDAFEFSNAKQSRCATDMIVIWRRFGGAL